MAYAVAETVKEVVLPFLVFRLLAVFHVFSFRDAGSIVGVFGGVLAIFGVGLIVNVGGISDFFNDFLYCLDVHGFHALFLAFPEQFCHTVFDVVDNLLAAFLTLEIALHALQVVFEQLVGILVDGVDGAEYVDADILFHGFYDVFGAKMPMMFIM